MIICTRCGTQNAHSAQSCGLCGISLIPSETQPQRPAGPSLSRTMVGQGPPVAIHEKSAEPPAVTPTPLAALGRHATMVGISPPNPVPPAGHSPHPEAEPPPDALSEARRTARMHHLNRTVIGIAPPAPRVPDAAPEPYPLAGPPRAPEPAIRDEAMVDAERPNASPQIKTILGVARPGIAPIHPGLAKDESPPLSSPPPPSIPPQSERRSPPPSKAAAAVALVAAGLLLAAGAFVYFLFLSGPGPIEGRATLDAEGRDRLELTCTNCEDGTRARLGNQQVLFRAGRASLSIPSALRLGENRFELGVTARGSKRERNVALSVPLEFRIRGDTSTLSEPTPRLRVVLDAMPKSRVVVDAKPLELDGKGHAESSIDISSEIYGPDPVSRSIERKVPYSITPPGGTPSTGAVELRIGVVPLTVEAPGESITTDQATFVLAGRTQKGGSLSIGDRALSVDAEGRFAQTMGVSALGETTVTLRASAQDRAPRLYRIRVRRVASLAGEARALRSTSTASYAAIATDIQSKRGWKVALEGSIAELGGPLHSTLLLLDAKSGCQGAPCLARVVYGGRTSFARGDQVAVFGRVQGEVDGPRTGSKIPEITADFLIKGSR